MLLDVRPDHLKIVQDILQRFVPDREVWAFGSRAKWLAKEYSDLDLCILGATPLTFSTLGLLEEAFDESDLPYKVDVVDWATTSEAFRKIIERDKVVIQSSGLSGSKTKGWITTTVQEMAERVAMGPFGSSIKVETFVPFGVPVISGQHLREFRLTDFDYNFITKEHADKLSKANVQRGDVIFTHAGNIGQVAYIPETSKYQRYVISQRQFYLRPDKNKVLPEFLTYYFKSPDGRHKLLANASSSGVPSIAQPVSYLRTIELLLPPLTEQKTIVEILNSLDDKIALLRETNATLEAIAQALFKSWFVNFDPVRAKAEGREPEGITPEIAALFPSEFEDSELGEIPKGWKVGTLAKLATLNPESWTAKKHPATVAYIDLANAKDNEVAAITEYVFDDAPSRARRVLRNGDTIVGTVRPGNRSFAFIHEPAENLTASTGFAVLRPIVIENTEFVYLAATQEASIEHLAHVADGGAYPAVRPEVVAGLTCVLACEEVMRVFHETTSPLLSGIAKNQRQTETLATLRDTLLPRLMSGKLRLSEAGETLEDATLPSIAEIEAGLVGVNGLDAPK